MATNPFFSLALASSPTDGQPSPFKLPSLSIVKLKDSCPYLIQSNSCMAISLQVHPGHSPKSIILQTKWSIKIFHKMEQVLREEIWRLRQEGQILFHRHWKVQWHFSNSGERRWVEKLVMCIRYRTGKRLWGSRLWLWTSKRSLGWRAFRHGWMREAEGKR